jgi:predicted Zn-dependent protease
MAQILVRRGEFKEAAPYAVTALRGNPSLLQVRLVMAKIYLAENRTDIAIEELEKAAPADPDGSYHYLLHRVLKSAGRHREAAEALAEFRRLRAASRSGGTQ